MCSKYTPGSPPKVNTLMLFWPIISQRKTSLVFFLRKENEFSCLFGHNIISLGLYQAIRNNIVTKKTTELFLLFHKNKTKLVFLWPYMGQKIFKVLISVFIFKIIFQNFKIFFFQLLCNYWSNQSQLVNVLNK